MQLGVVVHHQLPQVLVSLSDTCGTEGVPSNAFLCWYVDADIRLSTLLIPI